MLKWIIRAIFCFMIVGLSSQQQTPQQSRVAQFFSARCYNNSRNAAAYDALKVNVEEFKKYAKYTFTYLPQMKTHFCKIEREHLSGRVKEIAENLKQCLPPEEQYFPKFIRDVFDGFLHFLCHNDGENVDNFFSSQGEQCRQNTLSGDGDLDACFSKIFPPVRNSVKKAEICEDMSVAKKCFAVTLEKKCPNFKAFQELNHNLFKYLEKPCSTSDSSSPVVAVPTFFLILISYIFTRL